MKYFNKLFGIYSDPETIQINIIGKTFSYKKKYLRYKKMSNKELLIELNKKMDAFNSLTPKINHIIKDNIATALLHKETFSQYKNICNGREIMFLATGPSAKYFCPIDNTINIGVNKTIFMENIKLDYYFTGDYRVVRDYEDKIVEYDPNCTKFFALSKEFEYETSAMTMPESLAIRANAKRFKTDWFIGQKNTENKLFTYDIDKRALCSFKSIVFPAIQFAMFTNPKRVYLVGCDCTTDGYFDGTELVIHCSADIIKEGWKKFKLFKDVFYPEYEIVSINPVGLRGLFKDVYTESYLEEHPEIDRNKVEIIDPKAKLN